VLPGPGATTGKEIVSNPLLQKVDITVGFPNHTKVRSSIHLQAGTATGRTLGKIIGSNLAAYTAELGGKVGFVSSILRSSHLNCV
jgi:acyl-CoA reductase-like NAD-dependent aldehyde dehydrogenase